MLENSAVAVSAKASTRMDGLFDSLEMKISQTQEITGRVACAAGRLSGEMTEEISKDPAPTQVRNGAIGRFEDNLDRLEKILNHLNDVAAHLDQQV